MDQNLSSENQKVFIVGPTESVLTRRGNRHPNLAIYLSRKGYQLVYLTSNFYHATKVFFSQEEIVEAQKNVSYELLVFKCLGYYHNVTLRRILANTLLTLKIFVYLLFRLNRNSVLIIPSRPVELIFAAALLRIIKGNSVLLDIQDVWPDAFVMKNRLKSVLFKAYCNAYLYPSIRWIDKVIHIAPSFLKWLHRYAPRLESEFIPLGFDRNRWEGIVPRFLDQYPQKIYLVFVGLLQYQIDLMPVIVALRELPNIHLTVIGDGGEGERYSAVREFVDQHGMTNVEFAGYIKSELVGRHLETMHIGVVPMISSSIPNKVFDYIAAYLPILALGRNDSSDFVSKFDIGWTAGFDAGEICGLLKKISFQEINQKVRNIQKCRERFERENLYKKIETLISEKK